MTEHIMLWQEDRLWVIRHRESGVTTQGRTRYSALANLIEALRLKEGSNELVLVDTTPKIMRDGI